MPAPTNVVRLYNWVAQTDAKGVHQDIYYHPGVGSSGKWWDKALGGGTGAGHFQPAEAVQLVAGALGKVEICYGKLFKNPEANFRVTKRHEAFPGFSLVGAIANGDGVEAKGYLIKPETFLIGSSRSYTPKRTGYLYVYANEAWNCYGNNRGHVALCIA